jgi:predicted dehydrogenase
MGNQNISGKRGITAASAFAGMAIAGASVNMASGQGTDRVRIGLIGCGGRGTGAVGDAMSADPTVTIYGVADLFEPQAKEAADRFAKQFKDRCQIKPDNVFWGFDAYRKLAAMDLDYVVMATPPVFRPYHLRACIEAGKSVFMEKPVAVDPAGARSVIESARIADEKGLCITCGTQRRHASDYMATMEQIHQGAIGELVGGQCYWNGGGIWYRDVANGMSELEWQCHNWYHFTWLSGDQLVEQHVHNIDVMNWCFGGPPAKFLAMGNRQTRDYSKQARDAAIKLNGNDAKAKQYEGDIYCHVGTEMTYPNGARVLSMGRHAPKSTDRVNERIVGTKGTSDCNSSIVDLKGEKIWSFNGRGTEGRTEEHAVLIEGMKNKKPVNEGRRIAESTLTAIGCRMSAFTGREISWDWLLNSSKLDYLPPELEKQLKPGPGIFHEVAIPGQTKLI